MAFLRDPLQDRRKSATALEEQLRLNRTCKAPCCHKPITTYKGPGDKHYCREHQLQLKDYGGLGKQNRPWSFAREWTCSACGYNPKEDPWFENPPFPFDDEVHKNRAMRSMLVGDHKDVRMADGGGHGKDNVQTLCQNCNSKKTSLYKDYQRGKVDKR